MIFLDALCLSYSSYWLIIKAVCPVTTQDKVRQNNQTEDSEKGGRVKDMTVSLQSSKKY